MKIEVPDCGSDLMRFLTSMYIGILVCGGYQGTTNFDLYMPALGQIWNVER